MKCRSVLPCFSRKPWTLGGQAGLTTKLRKKAGGGIPRLVALKRMRDTAHLAPPRQV